VLEIEGARAGARCEGFGLGGLPVRLVWFLGAGVWPDVVEVELSVLL
jgi:hypothetical protein